MKVDVKKLSIVELSSPMPGVRFHFKVMANKIYVACFQTEISKLFRLEANIAPVYVLYKLIVENKYRRFGIGSWIINYCGKLAIKEGVGKLVVWIRPMDKNITTDNLVNFYQKNGMRLVADRDSIYGVKDLNIR